MRKIVKTLKERKWFIFGFTSFVTLLAIVYVLSLTSSPIEYIAKTSFLKPTKSSVISLNKPGFLNETVATVYSSFLSNINKKTLNLNKNPDYNNRLQFNKKIYILKEKILINVNDFFCS